MENEKNISNKIMKLQLVTLPMPGKRLILHEKCVNSKNSLVVNTIAHGAMFTKMQNFALANILKLSPSDALEIKHFFQRLSIALQRVAK